MLTLRLGGDDGPEAPASCICGRRLEWREQLADRGLGTPQRIAWWWAECVCGMAYTRYPWDEEE